MDTAGLNDSAERNGRRGFIAAGLAVLLVAALLAVAPAPASADGSTPPGTTKVMTASNGRTGFGLTPGDVLTISFDVGQTPSGTFFDTWLCAGTTFAPRDDGDTDAANEAGCFPFLFWDRENDARSMSFTFGLEDSAAYPNSDLSGTPFEVGMPGLLRWFEENGEDRGLSEPCDLNGLYFITHDYGGGDHSNFLGPLSGIPCASTPVAYVPPVLTCSPVPAVPGGTLTCEVTGGDPDIDMLWRAAFDGSVFASRGVRLGPDGVGSFSFTVPRGAACGTITVELVEWLPPMTIEVACSPVPTSLPAGEGGVPGSLVVLGVLTLAGAGVLVRRMGVAAG
jgi:hypothetical protein